MIELSVVLPCYNEAGNLAGLLDRFRPLAGRTALELILVDNGSTDATPEVLRRELAKPENSFARQIRADRNDGYGHGIQLGLAQASAPVVGFSHADLQCPPEDLLRALEFHRKHASQGRLLVKGRRRGRRPWADRCVTFVYNRLAGLLLGLEAVPPDGEAEGAGPRAPDINAQPKVFDRELAAELAGGPKDFSYDLHVLWCCRRTGVRILEMDVPYESRRWGQSKLAANPAVRLRTAWTSALRILGMWRQGA